MAAKKLRRSKTDGNPPPPAPVRVEAVESLRHAHHSWELVARHESGDAQARAIAAERVLRSLLDAVEAGRDEQLRELERPARRHLATDAHGDRGKGGGRAAAVADMVRRLEADAHEALDAPTVAATFVVLALGSRMRSILEERGARFDDESEAVGVVTRAYARMLGNGTKDGERLLVAGYRALGLSKAVAEALKDSVRKRDERHG